MNIGTFQRIIESIGTEQFLGGTGAAGSWESAKCTNSCTERQGTVLQATVQYETKDRTEKYRSCCTAGEI
jgi:hypothetical protein